MKYICIIIFSLLISIDVFSQSIDLPSIAPDRPGMATPPFLVPAKTLQIESGFSYEKIKMAKTFQETTLYNSSLLRYGINTNSEIRIQSDFARIKTDSLNISGLNPITLGTKLLITESKGIIPKTSFLLNVTLPVFGRKDFRPANLAPAFYLLLQNDITEKLNVCYNTGIEYDGESPVPDEFVAVCFGYSFSDKLSGFLENYNYFSKVTNPESYLDLGGSYLLRRNLQLDLSGNLKLNEAEKYFMLSFGVSWMITR